MNTFKQYITESRSAPLYHATRFGTFIDMIDQDQISAHTAHNIDKNNRDKWTRVVSLTRSLKFAERWGVHKTGGSYVILQLDQQKIAQRYKIVPYNHFHDFSRYDKPATRQLHDVLPNLGNFPINQYEENVIGDIKPLSKYLTAVLYPQGIPDHFLEQIKAKTTVPVKRMK